MRLHEFFQAYANVPTGSRMDLLDFTKFGSNTLFDFHKQIRDYEEKIQALREKQQDLIDIAEKFLTKEN